MTLVFPGQKLLRDMDRPSVERLGQELRQMVLDMESEQAPAMRAIAVWWKWYEAQPKSKEKAFPFVGASNVVVPLIGIACDALASRSLAQATAAKPQYWTGRSENEDNADMARQMARVINWQADGNDFSLVHVLADQFLEAYITGRSVAALHYRTDVRNLFFGRTTRGRAAKLSSQKVRFARGPLIEHIPREHILWDMRHRIGDAPAVVRKHEWSWAKLRDMAAEDEAWDQAAIADVRPHPGIDSESEATHISQTKDQLNLRDGTYDGEAHDVREIFCDWSMLGSSFEVPDMEERGGEPVPLVAHLHMRTGRILRLVGMPYLLPYKPFIDFRFRAGRGVAKRLEQLQSIQTTIWNQAIDARTRANAVWAITRNARHMRTPLDPSRPILVDDMGELAPFDLPSSPQQDLPLMVAAQTMAERWMGQSDPLLGRDTRSGGHPAPATSTLALLEQTDVMSAGTDVVIGEELSRAGEALAILNQQFEDPSDGRIAKIFGERDVKALDRFFFPEEPIPGSYFFDVTAVTRSENPDNDMRRKLQTVQAMQNYGAISVQAAMMFDNPQVPPRAKAVWATILNAYSELMGEFLAAANIDDTENYLVQLDQLGIDAKNAFRQFAGEAARAAQGAGGGQPPGAALAGGGGSVSAAGSALPAPNGAGGGAGLPFAGGGLLQ